MSLSATNGARRAVVLFGGASRSLITFDSGICTTCADTLTTRRSYATETSTSTAAAAPDSVSPPPPPEQAAQSQPEPERTPPVILASRSISSDPNLTIPNDKPAYYTIRAGLVLSRTPRITRDLTAFEKAFYFYQRRLNERLALPFTKYFYYKRGTPADQDYKRKIRERLTPARDIGRYSAYGPESWNDELLVGAKESETEHQIQALVKDAKKAGNENDAEVVGEKKESEEVDGVPKPLSRVTEADVKGDLKSLDRALQRTVYLLVKHRQGDNGYWRFPSVAINAGEDLRMAAERALTTSAGPNVNAFFVGNHPIGHFSYTHRNTFRTGVHLAAGGPVGYKEFFLKGRILAGQVDLSLIDKEATRIEDFRWLTREEIEATVSPMYWKSIKGMLGQR